MKISIIIPIYNVSSYVRRCIESVVNQTYLGNMECVMIDDCTQDNSCDIIEESIQDYRGNIQFKLIHHEKNRGLSATRNTGINNADGDYLYFLDSDDYIMPECIQLLVDTLTIHPMAEIVQAGTVSANGIFQNIEGRNDIPEFTADVKWIKKRLLDYNSFIVTAWNKLIRKDFVLKNNLFFMEDSIHEDVPWLFFISKNIKNIAFCKKNTYFYTDRSDSIMGDIGNNMKRIDSWIRIAHEIIPAIDDVCRDAQVSMVFKNCLHPFYSLSSTPQKQKTLLKEELLSLSYKCSLKQKVLIRLLLLLPSYINERKIFYLKINNLF